MKKYQIIYAEPSDVIDIIKFIDSTFTKEGYGFVTSAQVNTEVRRRACFIARNSMTGDIIGVRIGKDKVYNLAVHPDWRRMSIGRDLIEILHPKTIRVKAVPVGHLSKEQLDNFVTPIGFYDAIGYEYDHSDYSRNFWQRGKTKAIFHKIGKLRHIQIFRKKGSPKQLPLWGNEVESDIEL